MVDAEDFARRVAVLDEEIVMLHARSAHADDFRASLDRLRIDELLEARFALTERLRSSERVAA